jgi:hypothetical protein
MRRDQAIFTLTVARSSETNTAITAELQLDQQPPIVARALSSPETAHQLDNPLSKNDRTALGKAVFRDAVAELFVTALSHANHTLNVRLLLEDRTLNNLAWHTLCAPIDGSWQPLALQQGLTYLRLIASQSTRHFAVPSSERPSVLMVAASPSDIQQHGFAPFPGETFAQELIAALQAANVTVLASRGAQPASLESLTAALRETPYAIVHVICHGRMIRQDQETVLDLDRHDSTRQTEAVSMTRFLSCLKQLRSLPTLLCLESCDTATVPGDMLLSSFAQRVIEELGIPVVLAMTGKVSFNSAQTLFRTFYQHLSNTGRPDLALSEAQTVIARHPDAVIPALFSRQLTPQLFPPRSRTPVLQNGGSGAVRAFLMEACSIEDIEVLCAETTRLTQLAGRPLMVSLDRVGGIEKATRIVRLISYLERYHALPYLIEAIRTVSL